jgi:hypothetical protein
LQRRAVPKLSVLEDDDNYSGDLNGDRRVRVSSGAACACEVDCFDDCDNESWYFDRKVGLYSLLEDLIHDGGVRVLMKKYVYGRSILYKVLPETVKRCPPEMQ